MSLLVDIKVKDVADSLDIHPFMLSRWRKEYREGKIVASKRKTNRSIKRFESDSAELAQLKKDNERLKKENDLLKKWQRFLAQERANDSDSSQETDGSV